MRLATIYADAGLLVGGGIVALERLAANPSGTRCPANGGPGRGEPPRVQRIARENGLFFPLDPGAGEQVAAGRKSGNQYGRRTCGQTDRRDRLQVFVPSGEVVERQRPDSLGHRGLRPARPFRRLRKHAGGITVLATADPRFRGAAGDRVCDPAKTPS
jgi:hypothetical protein